MLALFCNSDPFYSLHSLSLFPFSSIFGAPILSFITFLCFSSTFPKTNHLKGVSCFLHPAHPYGSGWKMINISSHRCLGESRQQCCSLLFWGLWVLCHIIAPKKESGRTSSCSNPSYTESVNPTASHLSPLSSKAKSLSST